MRSGRAPQYPSFSPTKTTVNGVRLGLRWMIVVIPQILPGATQSLHSPVSAHGVFG